ncbi:N-acetyltransferase [Paracoccus sp. IB05]|uniref:N-acetyltransferase n=1 Tax=Paracoccus sp. IB05 TaxID=2779367 RepID=UPI0018E6F3FD|nr:N-acetyltransferase [Paracoccus sp. IB05]MBJ2152846.1 N-acetyltransferase [Paracoccus sp. IB05]
MTVKSQKKIESFSLSILPMTVADIPRLHQLSVGAGWMHRPEDWAFALQLGDGVFAADEIGRVAGSAMLYPITDDFAALGMVIIAPRLIEHGTDHWLVEQMLDRSGGRDLVVSATPEAYPVYISHGFRAGRTVFQFQAVVPETVARVPGARAMRAGDLPRLRAIDAAAYPVSRDQVLDLLFPISTGTVIERDGEITGYALSRQFGRGQIIGPIVALNEEDAIALTAPHILANAGGFVRVDTRQSEGPFRDYLQASGLKLVDTVISMARGEDRRGTGPQRIFGLINQGIG